MTTKTTIEGVPRYIGEARIVGLYYPARCTKCGWLGSSEDLTDEAECTRHEGDRLCLGYTEEVDADYLLGVVQTMAKVVAQPQGDSVTIEAVAVTRDNGDGSLRLEWLLEGGIAQMELAGLVLFAIPEANDLCDEDGSAEVYLTPPNVEQSEPVAAPLDYGSLDAVQRLAVCRGDVLPASAAPAEPDRIKGMVETIGGQYAVMIDPENGHYGWTFKKHPDGQWVSGRKATEREMIAARSHAQITNQL